jgi:hypothetical protein
VKASPATSVFQGKVNYMTTKFTPCGFGFGFYAKPVFGGHELRIYLSGKRPGDLFGGDAPDAVIDIDSKKSGSAQYVSEGHTFMIEWNSHIMSVEISVKMT